MAVPVVEAFSIAELNTSGLTITTDKPAGTVSGDLLFFLQAVDGGPTLTPPAGATSINETANGSAVAGEISRLVAGGSEPATYSADSSISDDQILGALRISGFNAAGPIHKSAVATGNSSTPTCPDLTTEVDNCLILRCYVADGNAIAVEDAGYPASTTGLFNRETSSPSSVSAGIAHEDKAAQGAVGTRAFSLSAGDQWVAWTVAIPEDPGGGGGGGIFEGSTAVTAIFHGSTSITRIYDGSTQIWPVG